MQQYWLSNFSDVFCLNCIFVIDAAAVKQLVCRSFLKYAVFAVAMAAHEFFFISNQIFTVLVSFNSLQYQSVVASGGVRPASQRLDNTGPKKRRSGGEPLATLCLI